MKQNYFMLLAAMLLSCGSVFAQSENNESIKGDVNGDGRVDIVDVTTVIDIYLNTVPDAPQTTTYYFYVGTTKPTSLSQASVVESYPAEQTFTNTSGARSKIYVLTNSDKNVTMIDPGLGGIIDQDVDTTTIPGYKIFETYSPIYPGTILIRIS